MGITCFYMKEDSKTEKQKHIRNRSIRTDSLLRETSSHYIRQIGDADRKARILLIVTSITITIGVTVLTKNVEERSSVYNAKVRWC